MRLASEMINAAGAWAIIAASIMLMCAMLASGMWNTAGAQGPGGGRGGRGNDNSTPLNAPDPHVIAMAKTIQADPEDPIPMILADRKSVGDDTLERMMAAPVRAIMQRLAVLLKPSDLRSGGTARAT